MVSWAGQLPGFGQVRNRVSTWYRPKYGQKRRGRSEGVQRLGKRLVSVCVCAKEEATGRSEDALQLSHRDRIEGAWPRYWASWRKTEDTMNDVGGKRRAAEGQPGSIQTKEKLTRFAISEADGRVL